MPNGPRTVVAFLDDSDSAKTRLDFAIDLSSDFGAHIVGLFVNALPRALRNEDPSIRFARGAGIDDAIDRYLSEQVAASARLRQHLDADAKRRGVSAEWRTIPAYATLRDVAVQCTYSDLLILPPHATAAEPQPWSAADIVLTSGVAGILVPHSRRPALGGNVMIAWNASRVARRAVGDAMPFLERAQKVTVVVVDAEVGSSGHGEEPGADLARFLTRHGVETAVERVASKGADVGDVLVRCAERLGVELVVAGAYGHSRIAEVVLGSTTKRMLRETHVPYFLSH